MKVACSFTKVEIFHEFQPILNLKDNIPMGFEALIRSKVMPDPAYIFRNAKESGQLYQMDCFSIQKAIQTYAANGYSYEDGKLFLNILPSTILNEYFLEFIMSLVKMNNLREQEIILEISESEKIEDYPTLIHKISKLNELDFKIAIDDCGSGYSEIKSFIELEPNYVKLDRYFSKNLASSNKKIELIKSVKNLCEKFNCDLILEGIERTEDLETACVLGIENAQGFLLGKPSSLKSKELLFQKSGT